MQGNNYQVDKEPLLALPLKNIPDTGQQPFIDLVDKILAITNPPSSPFTKGGQEWDYLTNPTKQAKVKEYELQIDQMVYKLYGLTNEEIRTVDGFGKVNNE